MKFKTFILFLVSILFVLVLSNISFGETQCWNYNNQTGCDAASDCDWIEDPWGSWCQQKSCWNMWSQDDCSNTSNPSHSSYINKTCNWRTSQSSSSGWCSEIRCWSFDGTNVNSCVNNSAGKSCEWIDEYNASGYDFPCMGPSSKSCWTFTNQTSCSAVSGCSWGMCEEQGCWDSDSKTKCEASREQDTLCKWNTQYNYCYKPGCWDYTDSSTCVAGNSCKWENQYCSNKWCSDFSGKNETFCINNTASLNCNYEGSGKTCSDNGCWNVNNEGSCNATSSCIWEVYESSGWCEEV
ncbi:MAG: hypothetical protein AABW92_00945, partial [Nanoarchaeota archaeon]